MKTSTVCIAALTLLSVGAICASLAQTETAWGRAYLRGVSPDGVIVLSGEVLLNDPRLTIDAGQDGQDSRHAS